MNRLAILKTKLEQRELVYGFLSALRDPMVLPDYQKEGIDFILYDLEHGPSNAEQIGGLLQGCRSLDIPTIVRVQDALYHLIAKTIDLGADGIMLPRTETITQVETAIAAIRFAPIGRKGCGGSRQFRPNESFDQFQTSRLLIPQIESPLGVANLPDILGKYNDQIAGIVIGPYDLSVQAGTPLDIDSDAVVGEIMKTIDICRQYGKSSGIYCGDLDIARRWFAAGMNILWIGGDMDLLRQGIKYTLGQLNKFERGSGNKY